MLSFKTKLIFHSLEILPYTLLATHSVIRMIVVVLVLNVRIVNHSVVKLLLKNSLPVL
jgi:hypothetical protein